MSAISNESSIILTKFYQASTKKSTSACNMECAHNIITNPKTTLELHVSLVLFSCHFRLVYWQEAHERGIKTLLCYS